MSKSSAWQIPIRVAAGAFILNSGVSKRGMKGEGAEGLQGFAAAAYPQAKQVDAETFADTLSKAEMGLGAALLTPLIPGWLAGAGLTAFGAGLNGLYLKAPGQRQEGDIRPTSDGTSLAKDIWLTGMGLALIVGACVDRRKS